MSSQIQLVYTSQTIAPITGRQLDDLAHQAMQHNEAVGITGVLLYGGDRFIQLLEGERQVVESLYFQKIVKDHRHVGCTVLMNEPSACRLLPNWSMGRLYLQQNGCAAERAWDALCVEFASQDPATIFSRSRAAGLINGFIQAFHKRCAGPADQADTGGFASPDSRRGSAA